MNDEGESVERAAMIMGVPPERVHALVEEERHRRELESFKCDSIPVELTRSAVEQALARDPDLTIADLARRLDMAQADFGRAFTGKSKAGAAEKPGQRL